jgi:hypothetical protein
VSVWGGGEGEKGGRGCVVVVVGVV